jgi:hypothetical protein
MTTYSWIGASGADWSVAGDWSPAGGPPGIADVAIIPDGGTVSVGQPESIDLLSLAGGAMLALTRFPFTVAGSIDNAGLILDGATLVVAGAAVTLDGGGTLALSGTGDSSVIAAPTSGDVLVNADGAIIGTGTIGAGGLGLTNEAGGVIDAASVGANAATLTVGSGGVAVANAGLMEATTGTLALQGGIDIANTGTIAAAGGTVTVSDALISGGTVTSSGGAQIVIDGGALDGAVAKVVNTGTIAVMAADMLGTIVNQGTIAGGSWVVPGTITLMGGGVVSSPTLGGSSSAEVLVNVDNTISGGTFGVNVTNDANGIIDNGTFAGEVRLNGTGPVQPLIALNYGTMVNATIQGSVIDEPGGTIDGVTIGTGGGALDVEGGTLDGQWLLPMSVQGYPVTGTLDGTAAPVTNGDTTDVTMGFMNLLGTIANKGTLSTEGDQYLQTESYVGGSETIIAGPAGGQYMLESPTVSLTGGGQVALLGGNLSAALPYPLGAIAAAATGEVLVNVDNTISGDEGIGAGGLVLDNEAAGLIEATSGSMTLDPLNLANTGTLEADGGTLDVTTGIYTDLTGSWIADGSTIALPAPGGIAGVEGYLVLEGTAAELVSSTGTNVPSLTNSYLAPETILAGGAIAVFNGATFGIAVTPTNTVVVGSSTVVTGGSLQPFGNAGLLELAAGTVALHAAVNNTGVVSGFGSLTVAGAVMDNAGGTVAANGGLLIFQGTLTGGALAVDDGATLELSPGWFGGGSAIPVTFDTGNDLLQIDVADNNGTFSNVGSVAADSFVYGDTIVVQGSVVGGGMFPGFDQVTNNGATLGFVEGGQTLGTLAFADGTAHLLLSQDANNDELITVACFAAGTRILTARGEVPVQALRVGELVPTLRGTGTVRWLGYRHIDCRRHPRPREVWPIRVQAGAFAAGAPRRDLWLSPDHAVYVDGMLVPVRYLLNGASIAQVEVPGVQYWHVELDRHAVILAEGLAAESYLDTGNRSAFASGGDGAKVFSAESAGAHGNMHVPMMGAEPRRRRETGHERFQVAYGGGAGSAAGALRAAAGARGEPQQQRGHRADTDRAVVHGAA